MSEPQMRRPVLDLNKALTHLGGDRTLLVESAQLFLEDTPRLMTAVREAVTRRGARDIEKCAHRVKGSLLVMAAGPAADAALELELLGRQGKLTGTAGVLALLEQEIERLMPEMESLADGNQLAPYGQR